MSLHACIISLMAVLKHGLHDAQKLTEKKVKGCYAAILAYVGV